MDHSGKMYPLYGIGDLRLSMCLEIIALPSEIKAEFVKKDYVYGVNSSNIKLLLNFETGKYAEINIGNLMQNKNRFKINFEDYSYIFDPINNKNIKEMKYQVKSIAESSNNNYLNLKITLRNSH